MSAYTRLINWTDVTADNIGEAREACVARDQAEALEPGASTWGIICEGGQRGQMSRWTNDRGAIQTGGVSIWGDWVPAIAPDGSAGEDMLQTEDGLFFGEHGTPCCRHGYELGKCNHCKESTDAPPR